MIYGDKAEIGIAEYEKLVQSLLWTADTIILPPTIRPHPSLSGEESAKLAATLEDLLDRGLLAIWDFDPDLPSRLPVTRWLYVPDERIQVLDRDAYDKIYSSIVDGTSEYRRSILNGIESGSGIRVEGITEFVSLQSALWNLGLTLTFDAGQSLLNPASFAAFNNPMTKELAIRQVGTPAFENLLDVRNIRGLAHLSVDDILHLRKDLPHVRRFVSEIVSESFSEIASPRIERFIGDAKNRISEQFAELSFKQATEKPSVVAALGGAAIDWTVNILGLINPGLMTFSFIKPLAGVALAQRRRHGILWFMAELEERVGRAKRGVAGQRRSRGSPRRSR